MVDKVMETSQYIRSFKQLKKDHREDVIQDLKTIITKLINEEITTQKSNHPVQDLMDIHIRGDVILLYRYRNNSLIISLELNNLVNHKEINRKIEIEPNIKTIVDADKYNLEENLKIDSEVEVIKTGEKGKVIKFEDDLYTIKLDNDEEIKVTLDELKFNDKDNLTSEDIDDKGNIINKEDTSTSTEEVIDKVIDVEEAEIPPTKKEDISYAQSVANNVGILDLIKDLIKEELDAVQSYNNAIAACINNGYDKFIPTFASLVSEEMVHVGELQKLQSILQPNTLEDLKDGQNEAKEDLEKVEE